MRTIQHIMVATDGSEAADRVLDVAAAIIKAVGGELSILTVGEQPSGDELRRLARSEGDIGDALESLSNRILKQANDRARRLSVSRSNHSSAGTKKPSDQLLHLESADIADQREYPVPRKRFEVLGGAKF